MAARHEEHGSVTPYQFTAIVVGAVIGGGILAFPRFLVAEAGTGAPLASVLGLAAAAAQMRLLVWLGLRFPDKTLFEYQEALYGRLPGGLAGLAICAHMVVVTALAAREFGEVVVTAVLHRTPVEVTTTLMLILSAYVIRRDLQVIARVFEVFFPLMIFPVAAIALLSLINARSLYLLPLLGDRGPGGLARGAAHALAGYVPALVAGILVPNVNLPHRAVPAAVAAVGVAGLVYLLVLTASLAVFGPEYIQRLVWPTLELARMTTLPGFFLERLDAAFLAIWVAAVFTTVAATYYLAAVGLSQLLRLHDHRTLVFPLLPVLHLLAFLPRDQDQLYAAVVPTGLAGALGFTALVVLGAAVAGVRGKRWRGRGRPS